MIKEEERQLFSWDKDEAPSSAPTEDEEEDSYDSSIVVPANTRLERTQSPVPSFQKRRMEEEHNNDPSAKDDEAKGR